METSALTMFLEKYKEDIAGVISCYDRVVIRGTLPAMAYEGAINNHLQQNHIFVKDFTKYAKEKRDIIIKHIEAFAIENNVPLINVHTPRTYKKELEIQKLIVANEITTGYVAILKVVESCRTYRHGTHPETKQIWVRQRSGKCLHYYIYFIDQTLGLCYVRLQTYLPCDMQIYFNGHNYLANKMIQKDIQFQMIDNAFVHIGNYDEAQKIVDNFKAERLKKILDIFTNRFIPFLAVNQWGYRWTVMQMEYATDIIFKNPDKLRLVYGELSHMSVLSIRPQDIAHYFETKYSARTKQTIVNRMEDRSFIAGKISVTRVKHQKGANAIKMYDKVFCILRVETTINDPHELYTFRLVPHRNGTTSKKRAYVPKSIFSLYTLAQIAKTANFRYLDTLAAFDENSTGSINLFSVAEPVYQNKRSYPGFNLCKQTDALLLRLLLQKESIQGLRNKELRHELPHISSSAMSRILKRLRLHRLIRKIPSSYRYNLTKLGRKVAVAALAVVELKLKPGLAR
ncbi:MAG: winged helix-turn-helix transcriptional regulator, partial [Ignavibacteriales bacterium]|nr:winged helix-turn-helix transcriptional regulator [Ignavibacteriales bacterium]